MSNLPNDDLFEGTKMTFGEHLEELRGALFRALTGLCIGFLLGLVVARPVVLWIKTPVENALQQFYMEKAKAELAAIYGELPADLEKLIDEHHLVYDELYVERSELERFQAVLQQSPSASPSDDGTSETVSPPEDGADGPGTPTADMVKTRVWKPIEAIVKSLSVHETFLIWVKAALITGAILVSPWIFWQIWDFVAAGLYPHEKRYVHVFLPFSLLLFLAGAGMAFFFVFEPVLEFLFSFNKRLNIDPDPRISEWMSFVMFLPLGFGISFQLPLVMMFLERIGIFSVEGYLSKWRIAVLVIFVIAMLLTPADPVSMLLMAGPLTILYFGGIALCKWMPRRRSPFGEGYEP